MYACALVGPSGKILSLEPHPLTREICHQNLEINGLLDGVKLLDFAASDTVGELVDFQYFPEHPAMSGFQVAKERLDKFSGHIETISVTTTTVDALLSAYDRDADLIKIDVEGFELQVLNGCKTTLSKTRDTCYLIEYGKELAISVNEFDPIETIYNLFNTHQYHAFKVENNGQITPLLREALLIDAGGGFFVYSP